MSGTPRAGSEVRLEHLEKRFGAVRAAADVSLTVPGGQFVTLLGPSGSGKTTSLMMVAGFVEPDAGDVFIGGERVTRLPPHRRSIGMVFQHYALFPHMTAFDNIAYPLRMRKTPRTAIAERVKAALEMVRLGDAGGRYPRQLSGGQQQRVALARALVFEPHVLLMDEPLGALDRKLREHMQVELRALQQRLGITTLSVTHDQEEAMALSDQIVIIRDGAVEQVGPPAALYERPATLFVADFLGASNTMAGRLRRNGDGGQEFVGEAGLRFAVRPLPSLPEESAVQVVIRPERVRWASDAPTEVTVAGVVTTATYLGERLRYEVAVHGGATLVVIRPNIPGVHQFAPGAEVHLGWNHADAVILDGTRGPA